MGKSVHWQEAFHSQVSRLDLEHLIKERKANPSFPSEMLKETRSPRDSYTFMPVGIRALRYLSSILYLSFEVRSICSTGRG